MSNLPYTRSNIRQWARETLRGIFEAPMTPITADFQLDEAGIHHNIEKYLDLGVEGLVTGGNLSEGWNMTPDEWKRCHAVYAEAARGKAELFTIILDSSPRIAVEKLNYVQSLGFTGAEIMNPPFGLVTEQDGIDYFKYISDHSDMAIVVYRSPSSGRLLSHATIAEIMKLPTVVGMKQGSLRAETVYLREVCPEDSLVMQPLEWDFMHDLWRGGVPCMFANYVYTIYGKKREMLRSYMNDAVAGNWKRGWDTFHALRPVQVAIDKSHSTSLDIDQVGSYVRANTIVKAWFEAVGFKAGPPLPPLQQVSAAVREQVQQTAREIGVI
ncbi:MAG: dihydrodipicolinate synthase family protein [Cellvibrionales bacterium]|nr:dihydrodipicolinate synthase family protein [Cellvibrionales bacterium]